jgi:hypothetical protein
MLNLKINIHHFFNCRLISAMVWTNSLVVRAVFHACSEVLSRRFRGRTGTYFVPDINPDKTLGSQYALHFHPLWFLAVATRAVMSGIKHRL